jgi:hypothetical protein
MTRRSQGGQQYYFHAGRPATFRGCREARRSPKGIDKQDEAERLIAGASAKVKEADKYSADVKPAANAAINGANSVLAQANAKHGRI